MSHIYYLIIIIIGIIIYQYYPIQNDIGPNAIPYNKGRGETTESISKLLDRIEWILYANKRKNFKGRYFIIAVVLTFLIGIIITNELLGGKLFLFIVLLIMFVMERIFTYYDFHSDQWMPYSALTNIDSIRKKLNIKNNIQKELEILNNIPD